MSNRKFYKKLPNGSFMEMESYEYYGTKKSFSYGFLLFYLGICVLWLIVMLIVYLIGC